MNSLTAMLARDRLAPLLALAAVTMLAWSYLVLVAPYVTPTPMDAMPNPALSGMAMEPLAWTAGQAVWMVLMWVVMMAGMMLPSAAPMVLVYDGVARKARADGHRFAAAGWFAAGYLLAWTGFAILGTAEQFLLQRAALLSADMAVGRVAAAILCLAFGLYQFTPLKRACLEQCRAPLAFIQRHGGFRPARSAALGLGLRHGLYCIGCCWALMALLFVGGVMNLIWVAALSVFVLAEKVFPRGNWIRFLGGAAGLLAGGWLLFA